MHGRLGAEDEADVRISTLRPEGGSAERPLGTEEAAEAAVGGEGGDSVSAVGEDESEPAAFIGIAKAHAARRLLGWGRKTVRTTINVGRWRLYCHASLAELRDRLPELPEGAHWLSNESQERFGLLVIGDEDLPDIGDVPQLIGVDPVIAEEFDVE